MKTYTFKVVVEPDEEALKNVNEAVQTTGTETVLPGSKGKWSPRWSPDGRTILAQTTDFSELDLFDCKTQAWKPVARVTNVNEAGLQRATIDV